MKIRLLFLFATMKIACQAQNIGFGLGGNISALTFKSEDATTQQIRGLPGVNFQVSLSQDLGDQKAGFSRYRDELNQLFFALGYKSFRLEDAQSPVISNWTMHYLTSQFGFRSHFSGAAKTNLFYTLGGSLDYLVGGTQVNGFTRFEISETLKNYNAGAFGELGLKYSISDESYTTISLAYLRGIANLEKDEAQIARLHSWQITVAIHFTK